MVAPLKSRGAEVDFWSGLQRQHSVLCVSWVCQDWIYTGYLIIGGAYEGLREAEWNICLLFLVIIHCKDGAAQEIIILHRQQHY